MRKACIFSYLHSAAGATESILHFICVVIVPLCCEQVVFWSVIRNYTQLNDLEKVDIPLHLIAHRVLYKVAIRQRQSESEQPVLGFLIRKLSVPCK